MILPIVEINTMINFCLYWVIFFIRKNYLVMVVI
nr:MAG TPA: hypothetical protein [Caudoviricetes sp.]